MGGAIMVANSLMITNRTARIAFVTVFFIVLCWGQQAWAYTLSGTVYGGSNPVAGATVSVATTGGSNIASTTTDIAGTYSVGLSDGSYTVDIQPPGGSGFGASHHNSVAVSGSDAVLNIVLLPQSFRLSGVVRNRDGTPVSSVGVSAYLASDPNRRDIVSTSTGLDGTYALALSPDTYKIRLYVSRSTGLSPPSYGTAYLGDVVSNVSIQSDTTQDIVLPYARVSGRTVDTSGSPVGNVSISVRQGSATPDSWDGPYLTSDSSGNYAFSIRIGSNYSLSLTPSQTDGKVVTTTGTLSVSGNTQQDLILNAGAKLTGLVLDSAGNPVSGVGVSAYLASDPNRQDITGGVSDTSGRYEIWLAPNIYKLRAAITRTTAMAPPTYGSAYLGDVASSINLQTDTAKDIALPYATISGRTVDRDGSPVGNVRISIRQGSSGADSWDGPYLTSDSAGNYAFSIRIGSNYSLSLSPAQSEGKVVTTNSLFSVSGNEVRDLLLDSGVKLTGVVRDGKGTPVSGVGVSVYLATDADRRDVTGASTDSTGAYAIWVKPETYNIRLYVSAAASIDPPTRGYAYLGEVVKNLVLQSDAIQNITLPYVAVSGHTVDSNGVPVRGVALSIRQGSEGQDSWEGPYVTSDSSGQYAFSIRMGSTYSQTITPPANSGFSATRIEPSQFLTDLTQNVVLSYADTTPPEIVSGPVVTDITSTGAVVQWLTDEPASGSVTDGNDTVAESGPNKTLHSVVLTNLTANTDYTVTVSSTDTSGNSPITKPVSFKTLTAPDITPPAILAGPVVDQIGINDAIVTWETSEPTATVLNYGPNTELGSALADSIPVTFHRVELSGLTADTQYYLTISATDLSQNGPTVSPMVNFRTLVAPDAEAPVIVRGPFIMGITSDGATIVWTTDEPATSGVSYNDGTAYGVITDETLSTEHSVRITGLKADTTYTVTASSKDASSNGPTLSPSLSLHTLALPDTEPPVLVSGPEIVNITHQSVVIRWETDEPADALIHYGKSADLLDQVESKAQLITHHNLTIVGLEADTEYFFSVSSTDAAGNTSAASSVIGFRTDALKRSDKPAFRIKPHVIHEDDDSITLEWETDRPMDFEIHYGEDSTKKHSKFSGGKATKHQVTLTKLKADREYHFAIGCRDEDGNELTSD
jgi:5-hydroxyisourate hydrolase-like protein (transthyretin family)